MTNESTHTSIKEWSETDRPREKMVRLGRKHLSDAELLAIIIGSGNKDESAVELARTILHAFDNDLDKLERSEINFLCNHFRGIGEAKAIAILASLELGKRLRLRTNATKDETIKNSKDLYHAFSPYLHGLQVEEVWLVSINKGNKVTNAKRICSGGTDYSMIDIKLILHEAISNLSSAIAIAHNHPSGNTTPSDHDIKITKKLDDACRLCNITLLDHIIYGDESYFSFADMGML